jgi:hypothetical protein
MSIPSSTQGHKETAFPIEESKENFNGRRLFFL